MNISDLDSRAGGRLSASLRDLRRCCFSAWGLGHDSQASQFQALSKLGTQGVRHNKVTSCPEPCVRHGNFIATTMLVGRW